MEFIFSIIIEVIIFLFALAIFIQCSRDLLCDPETIQMLKSTRIGGWINNRRNKVKVISEEEYNRLWSGKNIDM